MMLDLHQGAASIIYIREDCILIFYLFTSVVIGLFVREGFDGFLVFKTAFVDAWEVHLIFFGILAAYLAIPWEKFQKKWREIVE